jgi:hypothetical protein
MSRLFLIGMTQNQVDNIRDLTNPIYEHIDGLCFVDHGSTDGTRELLEERKGDGKVLDEQWVNAHDYSLNHILLKGGIKEGDRICLRDSMERFNPTWAKELPNILSQFISQGIESFYYCGKGFAFVFNDRMVFNGSPHWGLEGRKQGGIDLSQYWSEESKTATWRIKDGEPGGRPFDNKINHEAKYAWTYGRSNHLLLGLEKELDQFYRAEEIRQQIRDIAREEKIEFDMDGLKKFMEWFREVDYSNFRIWINSHRVWKNFYRYRILGEDFYEVEKNEREWVLG